MKDTQLRIAHIGWLASCHLVRRVEELSRRGVFNVVFTDNVPAHFDPAAHDFEVVDLPKGLFREPLRLAAWLEKSLADMHIDLVHAHSTHFPASLAYFVRNTPVICSPWDFAYSRDPFSPLFHRAILGELPGSTLLDGVSFSSKTYLDEVVAAGLPVERAFWHSWGVDLSTFAPGRHAARGAELRKRLGIAADETVFLSPRTPSLPANADIAMQAVAELARTRKVRLIVTGHHITRESGYYERLLKRPDIAASTVCIDTVRGDTDIAALYEASDVVLSMHSNDFNPATVLESFAMERPVVVHNLKTVAFWVHDGVNGWTVPQRDVQATVKLFKSILALDADARREMGRRGRERVLAQADFSRTMDQVPGDYRSLIELARTEPRPPMTTYDKGLLHDICNCPTRAAEAYRQALLDGEDRALLPELLEEKTAMLLPDKGMEYFCTKRSQPGVRAMAEADPADWRALAKELPVPLSLFRHDYLAGMLPLIRQGDYCRIDRLIDCLAERFSSDTPEWVGEAIILFGRRFGMWKKCAELLAELEGKNRCVPLVELTQELVKNVADIPPQSKLSAPNKLDLRS